MSCRHFAARHVASRRLPSARALAVAITLFIVVALLRVPVAAQSSSSAAAAKTGAKTWTPPHTPDGQPDLQGYWTNATTTPLERPNELAGKDVLTEQEAAEVQERGTAGFEAGISINASWFERGNVVEGRRTSLIVDPPDGKIPPMTPRARERVAATAKERQLHPADGPEDRSLGERCLVQGNAGPPMLPTGYNNNYQIVQGAGYVTILIEMGHEARIIPVDGRPHLPPNVRQWLGDSRGHWEGNTLVVDTTNFTDKTGFRGSDENLHLVERFTRTDADTIRYEFTIDDPTAFTKPWSAQLPMRKGHDPIYEYACNEGNYALADILAGAREDERRAAEAAKNGTK